ncbi:probable aminoacyl tRNA synthase complex-interacting multifunctional protein 2 [Lutzomyia longipalpis]|uniref:probable aminoacyl tRNA synthase complex-interacting multifunctional protein 2 n=1 Tax=Lutzomyia longipalpis TaxID=7200 RepID=UPI002483B1DD|nr:probable aminoacyl tRNA synthase complex-interacting multifunctional protein 2 [Lutzomyia longipalpis]
MYSLKPIVSDFDVEKPKNMYVIKEINPREEKADKFLTNLETSLAVGKEGDLGDLEEKQEILLEKLKELKRQLVSLQDGLPLCRKPAQVPQESVFPKDLVINVNPAAIPYSLLLMLKQKRSPLTFTVNFYTHSTVSQLPEEAAEFAKEIAGLSTGSGTKVEVIWKAGMPTNFEVIINPTAVFWGEGNFIRYLTRLGVLEKGQEGDDILVDMSHQLQAIGEDRKEQAKLADRLMGAMRKQKITQSVDFATYSALRNFRNATKSGKVDGVLKEIEGRL